MEVPGSDRYMYHYTVTRQVKAFATDLTVMGLRPTTDIHAIYIVGYSAQINCIYLVGCQPIYVINKVQSNNIL